MLDHWPAQVTVFWLRRWLGPSRFAVVGRKRCAYPYSKGEGMGFRTEHEPPYPQTQAELEAYCGRLISALVRHLEDRLACVLLCGSWARGEARPPDSDVDLTVVIDTVDESALDALRTAWQEAQVGYANVYGADEGPVMSRIAAAMYTTNAVVLYGRNPFEPPTKADFV